MNPITEKYNELKIHNRETLKSRFNHREDRVMILKTGHLKLSSQRSKGKRIKISEKLIVLMEHNEKKY